MNTDTIFIAILSILLVASEVRSYIERKDFLDRLMAKSLPEYKDNAVVTENDYKDGENPNLINIEDAEEEILNQNEEN
jgi:hypothetical protein